MTTRLDSELVRRGLARSRGHAGELIAAGRVSVRGTAARRAALQVDGGDAVEVVGDDDPGYASRGAHKLAGVLDTLGADGPVVAGRRCLDAGASTGGFTDVLLRRGAAHVTAVDVGHGQLLEVIRQDPRVDAREGVNVRDLQAGEVQPPPTLVVADLSFISLALVLPALTRVAAPGADLLVMVKPQFEVGRERLGSGGVVRDPALRADAVLGVARAAVDGGLDVRAVVRSPLPGPSGNVEFFLWLRAVPEDGRRGGSDAAGLRAAVQDVVVGEALVRVLDGGGGRARHGGAADDGAVPAGSGAGSGRGSGGDPHGGDAQGGADVRDGAVRGRGVSA
ncbi:TlyA family RNA methyltransferase [Cellulomonas fimi]|uniref:Hemolysin A n=1 Tax=Cellulomonas fimi (strain ATCC 484 / DSM 20113 / JCM 1341 / CCUG 24087 / LMG 16345 / NBRC 15513 / NCIMB 8980 / NCTC 7547 / NRS-133) TaxID=590998 RepID=F4H8C6_CELFA|nr:TlyA family RNA methyltransferase [Cellulomonas fimi]AEE45807.1 hemolysin A [Cellulomonas fimi ATCC 484]NNH08964.1 TlyA family RNA methyltransferase [Cellulomonas fimi]VEH30654.1 16S/23S rRNA (cytidine-2'-O)-methyltransferase TlyA [Cellulomonas fimi]